MPRPPRFQSEHAQRIAVAVFTLALLLISLGLAWAMTLSRHIDWSAPLAPTTVGALRIELPQQWRRGESIGVEQLFTGASPVFEETRLPKRSIHVFRKDMLFPSPPKAALLHVLGSLRKAEGRVFTESVRQEFFRQGACVGIRFQARSQANAKAAIFTSRIAAMTEDGRRYWGVALHLPIHQSPESETSTELLFNRIVASMIDGEFSDANAAAFSGAGLENWAGALGPTVRPRMQPGSPLQPVTLVPADGPGGLCLVRVRGQIHVSAIDALPRLETNRGMQRLFAEIYGRYPTESELISPDPANPAGLLLHIDDGKKHGLVRQMVYRPVSEQRALLMELLAEPAMMPRAHEMAAAAVAAAKAAAAPSKMTAAPPPEPTPNGNGSSVESALARGRAIAEAQRAAIATAPREPGYMLRSVGPTTVGTYLDLRRDDPGSRLPLTRQLVGVVVDGDLQTLSFSDQAASADATTIVEDIATTRSQAGVIDRTTKYTMRLKGDELTFIRVPLPPGRDYLWSERIRPQFLPSMAEDHWRLEVLRDKAATWEAVVDRTAWMSKPYPSWIRYAPLDKAAGDGGTGGTGGTGGAGGHPKDAAGVITLRPMMAMDALTLWVNAAGRVIAEDVPEQGGLLAGAVWIIHRPATQRDVIAQYPRNADYIRIWQQEAIQDD